MQEFTSNLNADIQVLKKHSSVSIIAGCDLLFRYINSITRSTSNLQECKEQLYQKGMDFIANSTQRRDKIAKVGLPFIKDEDVSLY